MVMDCKTNSLSSLTTCLLGLGSFGLHKFLVFLLQDRLENGQFTFDKAQFSGDDLQGRIVLFPPPPLSLLFSRDVSVEKPLMLPPPPNLFLPMICVAEEDCWTGYAIDPASM